MKNKFIQFSVKTFALILLFLLISQTIFTQENSQQITALEINKPLERQISGGQKHEYKIAFAAGQYAKIRIEQKGINVGVRVKNAKGDILTETDYEQRNTGIETIAMFSAETAELFLTVESRQNSDPQAAYQIQLVEQRPATEKEIALDEAGRFYSLANRLWVAEKYSEALPFAERSVEIRKRELGEENHETGRAYFVLGNVVGNLGDLTKSEEYYGRALEISEKTLGKEHIFISSILNNWGVVYKDRGDYAKAESFYLRSLEIRKKTLDPNNLLIASVLNNLGMISVVKGDSEKAAEYYRQTLEIREKNFGSEHPVVATTLNNIANLSDDFATAEPLHLRILAIREKFLGADHPDVAQSLYNLARIYTIENDFAKAEPLCLRALAIYEKVLGKDHFYTTTPLNLLGIIYKGTGDYDKSEEFLLRAIAIKEKTQSPFHPELGGVYLNLAELHTLRGEIEKAIAAQKKGNEILEYNTQLNINFGSERQKISYLQTLSIYEDQTLTLNFHSSVKNSPAISELAATSVLQVKGRTFDAMSDSFAALRSRFDKQDQILFDNFNKTTSELVNFITSDRNEIKGEEYERQIKILEQKRDDVENQISSRSAGFYETSKSITLDQVKSAIPTNAALIEFVIYNPIDFKTSHISTPKNVAEKKFAEPRYAAFVINEKAALQSIELGDVKTINAMIENWRKTLRDPKNKDFIKLAREIDEKIMQPVRTLLGDKKSLLISPDGELNLIPFEALVDEKGKYLIEDFSFTYITGGRELLRMQTKRESKNKSLIIANPTFGIPAETTAKNDTNRNQKKTRRSITATRNLSDTYFAPLAGTIAEARSIQEQFPDATLLTGTDANETALKQTKAPRILHIATHGFFLEDLKENSDTALQKRDSKIKSEIESINPLLRSGIALSGANESKEPGKDDGILTALEASGLNLWGTKLVVLSACDTGLGDVKNGEGVYGLRRAFLLAGTESLVMSLWSVSDFATRELMTDYYKNLKTGIGRGESLRKVKLEMIKKKGREHPFYWAAFIQSGEWANLDGKR